MAGGLFTRGEILEALEALTDELVGRAVAANIHIVGGSAVALLYDDEYVGTRDVDVALGRDRDAVKEAAAAVAVERGYPDDWLNLSRPLAALRAGVGTAYDISDDAT